MVLQRVLVMNDFPILSRKINGKRLVYLDNAATTQKPQQVIDAISHYYSHFNANIHRGIYTLSEEATAGYEEARKIVADFIKAPSNNLVFTSGTTDSINLVAHGLDLHEGDEILLTPLEHHANIVPWQEAAKRTGAKVVFCDLTDGFTIYPHDIVISEKTKLIAITHVSNVTGAITPLKELINKAKERNIPVLVDGAQAVGHLPVDVVDLGCDFYAFSGHKLLGPTGIGALYISPAHMNLKPYKTGGDMINDVTEHGAEFAVNEPRRFEAGTPNIAGALGLKAAVDYLQNYGVDKIRDHEQKLLNHAWDVLGDIEEVEFIGTSPDNFAHTGILSFTLKNVHPHDVAQILDTEGICIRSGKHCAHPLLARMGVAATNRISFHLYNTPQDIDTLAAGLKKAIEVFK